VIRDRASGEVIAEVRLADLLVAQNQALLQARAEERGDRRLPVP
jgi:hypothetical protein